MMTFPHSVRAEKYSREPRGLLVNLPVGQSLVLEDYIDPFVVFADGPKPKGA